MSDVTQLLSRIGTGDPASEQLLPLVYDELRSWQPLNLRRKSLAKFYRQWPSYTTRTCDQLTSTGSDSWTAADISSWQLPRRCGGFRWKALAENIRSDAAPACGG